ncbi:hypothetical protein OAA26_00525 [bacterium]|nr:hypothetical protein [bacterium]
MANRDLLKEAIADAKAVKEVAIANAKAALEEAFTPQLKSMLSEKISQLDEEDDLAEIDKEKKMKEGKTLEKEGKEKMDEADGMDEGYGKEDMKEAEDLDEELDLEEILAELELEEGGDKELDEAENEMEEGYDDSMEEAEEGDDDAELDLENMSEEDLKGFIEDIIEDMIEDGELVPGPNADESEEDEMEDTDDGIEGNSDVDIEVDDIDLQEKKEKDLGEAKKEEVEETKKKDKDLKEAKLVIKHLQSELKEVNLLNSKLLYTNKIFKAKNLTENQKIKVLKAFDKAETVKEAKSIFETLNENLVAKTSKSNIRESLGAASKPAGVAPKRPITEQKVIEEDAMVNRFKKLAGIK